MNTESSAINTRELTKIGICVSLLCISAYIVVPLPFTPAMVTAQTIVVNLIALILKPKNAFMTMVVYILLGVCGLPVFSGATAGIGKLLGPTGGFITGFLISIPVMSYLKGNIISFRRYMLVTVLAGMPIIYLLGTAFMSISQSMDYRTALMAAVVPFIVGDIIKCMAGSYIAVYLNKMELFQRGEV